MEAIEQWQKTKRYVKKQQADAVSVHRLAVCVVTESLSAYTDYLSMTDMHLL